MSALYNFQAEDEARSAALRSWGINVAKPNAKVVPLDREARTRRPLGLAPVLDGPDDRRDGDPIHTQGERQATELIASSISHLSDEALAAPITWRAAFEDILSVALAGVFDGDETLYGLIKKLRVEIAELKGAQRTEVAELRLALTEARCEIREMKMIQENARTLSRGEQGLPGPRGIPGPPGEGRVGPQGPKGSDAAMIVGWEPTPERYWLTPVYSTGEKGVPANLTSLFEAYNAATEAEDEA
jgi:hypothetical protein